MMARTVLDKLCVSSEETSAYLNWLWVRMKNQIQLPLNWAMVEALANMLLEHKELDGPVSRAVFRETEKTWMRIRHQAIDE